MLRRLKLGREEFCQRMVTTLILGGVYPKWNTRSRPTADGARFLRLLDALSFGHATPLDAEIFVDELELRPRVESEKGGAPDWAVLWPQRLWLIELKTEKASHRRNQIPYYFELGAYHFPGMPVDITYLTPPMTKPAPSLAAGRRYRHLTWPEVLPLVDAVWGDTTGAGIAPYVQALHAALSGLEETWSTWREAFLVVPTAAPEARWPADTDLLRLIEATAADGEQRAVDYPFGSLEDVQALRLEARELVFEAPPGSPLKHVRPWIWSGEEKTTGRPLTITGAETGYELRFSRYTKPQYS